MGERINHTISRESYLAASALLCLTPYTPMLFMGQEWGASTPFIFFTDHNHELGKLITRGRREEFKDFSAFSSEAARARIPDPQEPKSFLDSKLIWDEVADERKSLTLQLYRACLALRRQEPAFRPPSRETWHVEALALGAGALRLKGAASDWLLLFDLEGGHIGSLAEEWICKPRGPGGWELVLSTNEKRFGGAGACAFDAATNQARFSKPELVVLRS
jgi:maltooligosyltrehalose trehalohydrolase